MSKPAVPRLVKIVGERSQMSVGDKRPGAAYEVWLGNKRIGKVVKTSESSYRSEGTGSRVLYGFRGYAVTWRYYFEGSFSFRGDGSGYTRKRAVENMLRDWKERNQ